MSLRSARDQVLLDLLDAIDGLFRSFVPPLPGAVVRLATAAECARVHLDEHEPSEVDVEIVDTTSRLPTYAHEGDAGADLRASVAVVITPGEVRTVPTGIKLALPPGVAGLICARSGLGVEHRLALPHGVGVIDSGYRGDVGVALANDGEESCTVAVGARVAQLLLLPVLRARWRPVGVLPSSSRGEGGWGSTGR